MGTKMAVHAFSVIFMAHFDKQLLHASPYKPFLCKRFRHIQCGLFLKPKSTTFNHFTNSFRTTINFTLEPCHQNRLFSLTLKFLKDQDSVKHILRPLKPTETFQNTHFSSFYPLSVKKGFAYGEAVSAKRFSQDDRFNNPTLRQKILDAL